MTVTYEVGDATSAATPRHGMLAELLAEAAEHPLRPGQDAAVEFVAAALREDSLSPERAHRLGQQLRLVAGDHPADDDVETHLLLQTIVFELAEITARVDGVHVDELDPVIGALLSSGQAQEAHRLCREAQAARARLSDLDSTLRADLGAA